MSANSPQNKESRHRVAVNRLLLGGSRAAGAELYFEVDTWQESEIKIGNVKILLVTPQRVEGCNFLCSCQETLPSTSQAAAAAAVLLSAPQLC